MTSYPWAPFEVYLRRRWPEAFEPHSAGVRSKAEDYFELGDPMPKARVGDLIGMSPNALHRFRQRGAISEPIADRLATRVGLHPSDIWHDWWRNA